MKHVTPPAAKAGSNYHAVLMPLLTRLTQVLLRAFSLSFTQQRS